MKKTLLILGSILVVAVCCTVAEKVQPKPPPKPKPPKKYFADCSNVWKDVCNTTCQYHFDVTKSYIQLFFDNIEKTPEMTHLAPCDHGRVCVWNKCHCRVGKPGCFLECSSDPRKKCNGLRKGEPPCLFSWSGSDQCQSLQKCLEVTCSCSKGHFAATCEKAGKLSCVPVPGQGKVVPLP